MSDDRGPTAPRSGSRRTLYRRRVDIRLRPGDTVTVERVPGWLETPLALTVPPADPAGLATRFLGPLAAGLLVFSGLLSLALGLRRRDPA